MKKHQVKIDIKRCVGCGLCVKTCPAHNIEIEQKKARIVMDACIMCGQCTAVCPKEAVSISGYGTGQIKKAEKKLLNPMDVLEVIRFRRTVRQFQSKPVGKEIMDSILEAGRLTHTAKNMQDVSFVVLDKEKDRLEQIAVKLFRKIKPLADLFSPMSRRNKIDTHFFFFHAPVVIMILAEERSNGILAAQNMEFVAEAYGLGVLYSGFFTMAANNSSQIKRAIRLPRKKKVAMTLVLGYPKVNYLRTVPREELDVRYM